MTTTAKGLTQIQIGGWLNNGGINPLIRTPQQLREVAGADYPRACRYAAIQMDTRGEKLELPKPVCGEGEWTSEIDGRLLDAVAAAYFNWRAI